MISLWSILALAGACLSALATVLHKKYFSVNNYIVIAPLSFLITAFCLLGLSWLEGFPVLLPGFWLAVITTTILNVIMSNLYYQSVIHDDISLVVPLLSFSPVIVSISALIFLHEQPTLTGLIGMLLIVAGVYLLNLQPKMKLWQPLTALLASKWSIYMLAVSLLAGISISFDKMSVLTSNSRFGPGLVYLLIALGYGVQLLIFKHQPLNSVINRRSILIAATIGLITTIATIAIGEAYRLTLASYVSSIHRLSILITVLLGASFFQEKYLAKRMVAASFCVIGAILIMGK